MRRALILVVCAACGKSPPPPPPAPAPAPPKPVWVGPSPAPDPAVMDEVFRAYDRGDYDAARTAAHQVLARDPTNVRMLRIVVSVACIEGDAATAQQHYDRLAARDRAQMKQRCERYGVTFVEPN